MYSIDIMNISWENTLTQIPQNPFDDESTLVQQAIAWVNVDPDLCRHIASLDLNEFDK